LTCGPASRSTQPHFDGQRLPRVQLVGNRRRLAGQFFQLGELLWVSIKYISTKWLASCLPFCFPDGVAREMRQHLWAKTHEQRLRGKDFRVNHGSRRQDNS